MDRSCSCPRSSASLRTSSSITSTTGGRSTSSTALSHSFMDATVAGRHDRGAVRMTSGSWRRRCDRVAGPSRSGPTAIVDATDLVARCDEHGVRPRHGSSETVAVRLKVPGVHNVRTRWPRRRQRRRSVSRWPRSPGVWRCIEGVERRFQVRGSAGGVTIVDDYAHHPTEVKATLAAARPGPWKRVVAIFQPHRYSRTAALASAFGRAFGDADRIVLMDVYGAGEEPVPGVTGKVLADSVTAHLPGRPVAYFPHRAELIGYLVGSARPGDLILTLGAGDVTTVGEELLARSGRRRRETGGRCCLVAGQAHRTRRDRPRARALHHLPSRWTRRTVRRARRGRRPRTVGDRHRGDGSRRWATARPGRSAAAPTSSFPTQASPVWWCGWRRTSRGSVRGRHRARASSPGWPPARRRRSHRWPTGRPAGAWPGSSGRSPSRGRSGGPSV